MEQDVQVRGQQPWTIRLMPEQWEWLRDEHARTFSLHRQSFNRWAGERLLQGNAAAAAPATVRA